MIYYIFLIWNLVVFSTFGIDKLFAKIKRRRIPEKILILFSAFFGAYGACFGMLIFNHKTSKAKFRYSVPFLTVLQSIIIYFAFKNLNIFI